MTRIKNRLESDEIAGIGVRFAKARISEDMSQQELAKRIGVSRQCIINIENGINAPSLYVLKRAHQVLGEAAKYEFIIDDKM